MSRGCHTGTIESETTLIIVSEKPEQICDDIVALATVGEYRLVPAGVVELEDVYFDTPDQELRTHRWALRIRSARGDRLFTLKGPSRKTEWGGLERVEIEAPWSKEAPIRIVSELSSRGVAVTVPRSLDLDMPPVEAMKRAGFRIMQTRRTRRDLKHIVPVSGGEALAELAADSVRFVFGKQELRHWELEIEAEDPSRVGDAQTLADLLLAKYDPALRRWNHGKLATGLVLEKLLQAGMLEGLVKTDRTLTGAAYDTLEEYLDRDEL